MSATPKAKGAQAPADAAPAEAPLTIAQRAAASAADVKKSTRVYVDVEGYSRHTMPDERVAAVQQELRADGSLGRWQLAIITPGGNGMPKLFDLADVLDAANAFAAGGESLI
jgi:uncharacterized membrane protein